MGIDFRQDVAKITIPTLIIPGDAGAQLALIKDAPHSLVWTHAEEVNRVLLKFLAR